MVSNNSKMFLLKPFFVSFCHLFILLRHPFHWPNKYPVGGNWKEHKGMSPVAFRTIFQFFNMSFQVPRRRKQTPLKKYTN